jgi:hypothetical protein
VSTQPAAIVGAIVEMSGWTLATTSCGGER